MKNNNERKILINQLIAWPSGLGTLFHVIKTQTEHIGDIKELLDHAIMERKNINTIKDENGGTLLANVIAYGSVNILIYLLNFDVDLTEQSPIKGIFPTTNDYFYGLDSIVEKMTPFEIAVEFVRYNCTHKKSDVEDNNRKHAIAIFRLLWNHPKFQVDDLAHSRLCVPTLLHLIDKEVLAYSLIVEDYQKIPDINKGYVINKHSSIVNTPLAHALKPFRCLERTIGHRPHSFAGNTSSLEIHLNMVEALLKGKDRQGHRVNLHRADVDREFSWNFVVRQEYVIKKYKFDFTS